MWRFLLFSTKWFSLWNLDEIVKCMKFLLKGVFYEATCFLAVQLGCQAVHFCVPFEGHYSVLVFRKSHEQK